MLDSPSNKLSLSFHPFFLSFVPYFILSFLLTFDILTFFSSHFLVFFHIFFSSLKTAYPPPSSFSGPLHLHRSHTSGFHASYFCLLNLIGQRGGRWMGWGCKPKNSEGGRILHFPSFFFLSFDSFILQGQLQLSMVLQRA